MSARPSTTQSTSTPPTNTPQPFDPHSRQHTPTHTHAHAMAGTQPSPVEEPTSAFRAWVSQAVVASFIAGGVAGAVSRTVVSPLERLKILLQVQTGSRTEYKMSIGKALGKIWREEGFKGMMAGNGTNCIRIVPYSAVLFGSYNFYKRVSAGVTRGEMQMDGVRMGKQLTRAAVLRSLPRRTPLARPTTSLRRDGRHHLRHLHLSPRHC